MVVSRGGMGTLRNLVKDIVCWGYSCSRGNALSHLVLHDVLYLPSWLNSPIMLGFARSGWFVPHPFFARLAPGLALASPLKIVSLQSHHRMKPSLANLGAREIKLFSYDSTIKEFRDTLIQVLRRYNRVFLLRDEHKLVFERAATAGQSSVLAVATVTEQQLRQIQRSITSRPILQILHTEGIFSGMNAVCSYQISWSWAAAKDAQAPFNFDGKAIVLHLLDYVEIDPRVSVENIAAGLASDHLRSVTFNPTLRRATFVQADGTEIEIPTSARQIQSIVDQIEPHVGDRIGEESSWTWGKHAREFLLRRLPDRDRWIVSIQESVDDRGGSYHDRNAVQGGLLSANSNNDNLTHPDLIDRLVALEQQVTSLLQSRFAGEVEGFGDILHDSDTSSGKARCFVEVSAIRDEDLRDRMTLALQNEFPQDAYTIFPITGETDPPHLCLRIALKQ